MAWVTALINKYRFDLFFRTECNVIALQVSFVILILILIGFSFSYLYSDITKTIFIEIINNVNVSSTTTPYALNSILSGFDYLIGRHLLVIIIIIILVTSLFGYLVALITLIPARNSLKIQKQFIGNIAHELRTPLSIIKTNLEVALLQDNFENIRIKNMLLSNIEELDRISNIINNLLSFNKLISSENIKFEVVDIGEIVDNIIEKLSGLLKSKNINLKIKRTGKNIIEGRPIAIEQIVINIMRNAIQYTPNNGSIQVTIEPSYENFIELRVEDNGAGISDKDIFHVLEPFYRADPSRTTNHGGNGLGLAIVNELVRIHSGKILIKSTLGKGTVVMVSFPPYPNNKQQKSST